MAVLAVDDVEVRLLHDLQTAGDIGLTMADLIDDLEGKGQILIFSDIPYIQYRKLKYVYELFTIGT